MPEKIFSKKLSSLTFYIFADRLFDHQSSFQLIWVNLFLQVCDKKYIITLDPEHDLVIYGAWQQWQEIFHNLFFFFPSANKLV